MKRRLPAAARRIRLGVEYAVFFFGAVSCWVVADIGWNPVPPLLLAAAAAGVYLRRHAGLGRRELLGLDNLPRVLAGMLALWLVAILVAVAALAAWAPQRLFALPREQPLLWTLIVVGYPLVSVYPQELIFRAFLLRRYAPVFGTDRGAAVASALAFGYAHLIYGNALAVALSTVGGLLVARRYQRTGSLVVTSLEHALYGVLLFTVGLGDLFYRGDPPLR